MLKKQQIETASQLTTRQGKTISLVLGSGGARGLAHIGVIRWLEEHDYTIASIVGCSMGACIGGIYAIGKLDQYEQWVRAVRKRDIVSLLDVTWLRGGLVKGDRLFNTLRELLGDRLIEDLDIPFTAVAVDIVKSREVWINRGPVFDAIRASVSIPLLFTPVNSNGRILVDGAVMNPIPIAPTFSDQTDQVIAVNVSGELRANYVRPNKKPLAKPVEKSSRSGDTVRKLQQRISLFLEGFGDDGDAKARRPDSISDVVFTAFDAMQTTIARQKLAAYPPDVLIDIPRNVANIMEFDRAAELIDLGYLAAEKTLGSTS